MEHVANRYSLLFSIKVVHPWFKDGICPYLTLEPDASTKKSFSNLRLLYSYDSGELRVKARLKEANELKISDLDSKDIESYQFIFLLKLLDYKLFEVTDIDVSRFPAESLYFFHSPKTLNLKFDKCRVTDKLINISFEKGKRPQKIKVKTVDNIDVYAKDIDKGASYFTHDMSGNSSGIYSVVSFFGKAEQKHAMSFYFNPLLRKEPVLGIINIYAKTEPDVERPNKNVFLLQFKTKD